LIGTNTHSLLFTCNFCTSVNTVSDWLATQNELTGPCASQQRTSNIKQWAQDKNKAETLRK
jgi:hypothetical protein